MRLRDRGVSILQWRPGTLVRHGKVTLGWMLLRAGTQAAMVVLLARVLGASAYGQVIAVLATASLVVSFAGLGLPRIVLRNAARDPTHEAVYFGLARRWWLLTLAPCMVAAIANRPLLLDTPQRVLVVNPRHIYPCYCPVQEGPRWWQWQIDQVAAALWCVER